MATFHGSAQVTGLLKKRPEDYFLPGTTIALDADPSGDMVAAAEGEAMQGACLQERGASNRAAAAAGCSTHPSGTGVLSTLDTLACPSLVITGVFDGHGGPSSARYVQEAMLSTIAADRALHASLGLGDAAGIVSALKAAFQRVDSDLLALQESVATTPQPPVATASVPSAPTSTYASSASTSSTAAAASRPPPSFSPSDPSFPAASCSGPICRDGTTALVTVQLGGLLAVANAGDCRAVLCRQGQAVRLSRDHTPGLRSERERIEAAGGQVVVARGAARVLAPAAEGADNVKALAVSRSLGDPDFKASGLLTSEPDVAVVPLLPGQDSFFITASDGLWGRVGDQDAVDAVLGVLEEYAHMTATARAGAAKAAARCLLKLAQDAGSMDDITVVVSVFAWAG